MGCVEYVVLLSMVFALFLSIIAFSNGYIGAGLMFLFIFGILLTIVILMDSKERKKLRIKEENKRREAWLAAEEKRRIEAERAAAERRRIEAERAAAERRRIKAGLAAVEKMRLEAMTAEIELIQQKYMPANTPMPQAGRMLDIAHGLCNSEVFSAVKAYKKHYTRQLTEIQTVNKAISAILERNRYSSPRDKRYYLQAQLPKLDALHGRIHRLEAEMAEYAIELINQDRDIASDIHLAFRCLQQSKHCEIKNRKLNAVLTEKSPAELALFKFDAAPVMLAIAGFTYCLFSNVILAFDECGIFSTALDPTALSISVQRQRETIRVDGSGEMPYHMYVKSDSRLVSQGESRTVWRFARKDGSPDLRYNDNRRITYRDNTYEYSRISLTVAGSQITFTASSAEAADAFEKMIPKYIRRCNHLRIAVPELLALLKAVSGENSAAANAMISANKQHEGAKPSGYFCRIVPPI